MPVCIDCSIEKPDSDFYFVKKTGTRLRRRCKSCDNAKVQQWRERNRERNAKNAYVWAKQNPDKVKISAKINADKNRDRNVKRVTDWAKSNPDRRRKISKEWVRNNPEKSNANTAKYKSSKIKACPNWAIHFFINEAYDLAKVRERVCGGKWEVDHIVPLRSPTVCGLHCHTNLQVIPKASNMAKGNRVWPDMPIDNSVSCP